MTKRKNLFFMFFLPLIFVMGTLASAQDLKSAFTYNQTGLMAQKIRMALTVENVANSSTMEDKSTGLPWQKRFAVLSPDKDGVKVVSIEKSKNPFGKRYDPSDPAANADGYLAYPNINLPDEMFNLSYTEVIFEANATALKTTKTLYQGFIDMMK